METEELQRLVTQFACESVTFEERRSMSLPQWRQFVETHYKPIPKKDLVVGQEYPGTCRNARKATWDGEKFHYMRTKWGNTYDEAINHYEDDDGYDVFVPVKTDIIITED